MWYRKSCTINMFRYGSKTLTMMLDGATYVLSEICYHYFVVEMLCRNAIPKPDTTNIVPQFRQQSSAFCKEFGPGSVEMSSASGYFGYIRALHFQKFGPRFFSIFSRLVNTLVQNPLFWGKACAGSYFQIFDMASTSGYIGVKHNQEVGPRFFDMSSV